MGSSAFSYVPDVAASVRNLFDSGLGSFNDFAPPLRAPIGPQAGPQSDDHYESQHRTQNGTRDGTQKGLFGRIQDGVLSGAQRGVQNGTQTGLEFGSLGASQNAIPGGLRNGVQNGPRNGGLNATHAARLQPVRTPGGAAPRNLHPHASRPQISGRRPNGFPGHNAAMEQRLRGEPPAGEFELPMVWRLLRSRSLRVTQVLGPRHPLQRLQEISTKTEAYAQPPDDNETKILIWGTPEQVENAKKEITQFIKDVEEAPKTRTWFKGYAVDGRAEHRQERMLEVKQFAQALKSADIKYPIEGGLLWSKTLDGNEFCRDNAAALDEIRLQFSCKIEFCQAPGEFAWMKVCVTQKKHLVVVISRITNIVKEYVSRSDQLVKMNLIRYPSFEMYRGEVGLLDLDPKTQSYLPTLHGAVHGDEEEWKRMQIAKHLANRRKIKSILDRTLKSLAISQRHVRMRVVFGELGFIQFQKPPNGAQSYQFDDFYKMVTQGRTKLNLNNVPVRQGHIEDLSDVLNSLDAFICPEVTYGAYFDFAGGTHEPNSLIRLDCSFGTIGDGADYEIQEMRWLEVNDMVGRLQLAMIDFERPDFQFTIDAFPLYENRRIIQERSVFQTNVSFKPHPQGLKAPPRMRVKVPPTTANLREVSEITTMKWCFKETDGVFELRRKDVFEYSTTKRAGILRRSTWHAVYYYPEWDNLMGQFGCLKPGQLVNWEKSIMTFFPEDEEKSGLALPKGFKGFMAEVDEVQVLLSEAIRQLARASAAAAEPNGANGTNGLA